MDSIENAAITRIHVGAVFFYTNVYKKGGCNIVFANYGHRLWYDQCREGRIQRGAAVVIEHTTSPIRKVCDCRDAGWQRRLELK